MGTNDVHGHVLPGLEGRGGLALLGGYLDALRAARARDGGGVLLVDAGDAFQGTLESNLSEGAAVVAAFDRLGYAAMAIGNHEFDFGPVGPASIPRAPGDDARGALKALAASAHYPFLAANLVEAATGRAVDWKNVRPSAVVEVAGVRVGLVGVTTAATPHTTMAEDFAGLAVTPLAPAIAAQARALRAAGCTVVIVLAHAGGACRDLDHPDDLASCDPRSEIFEVARALPPGLVDAIVAGHTHHGIAQVVAGIPVIESFAYVRAFGRVDLTIDRATGKVLARRVFPPRDLLDGARYEGAVVHPDPTVAAVIAPYAARARAERERRLGAVLDTAIREGYGAESPLGDLLADLTRRVAHADVGIMNGGALHGNLPAGPLTYGALFEVYPFDNRVAVVRMTGKELRAWIAANLESGGGVLDLSGVSAQARCAGGRLDVTLVRPGGRDGEHVVGDDEALTVATSDFLVTGGDGGFAALHLPARDVTLEDGTILRDAIAATFAHLGHLRGDDPTLAGRLDYPGRRPVSCR